MTLSPDPEGPPPVPTVIVVHPKERRSKCSVEPLRPRDDFLFYTFPEPVTQPLEGYIRLGLGGEILTSADADQGLFVLDGTWKLAARMEPTFADIPIRTLPPVQTAYPRVSKVFDDPTGGLATVEAVYAALKIMGRNVDGILDKYHWKHEFLKLNGWHSSNEDSNSPATP